MESPENPQSIREDLESFQIGEPMEEGEEQLREAWKPCAPAHTICHTSESLPSGCF